MRALFVDANETLAAVTDKLLASQKLPVSINRNPSIKPDDLPGLLGDAEIMIVDHTAVPSAIAEKCAKLKHVVFLGTGARSYMNPEELAGVGIAVHTIKGYGDTAVAECAIGLMWAAARKASRDGPRRCATGNWLRSEGMQLTGKTLGLIGFGGIAAEVARMAAGIGMKVIAWNRTPKTHPGVEFVSLERLLAESDAVSLHLLLNDETKGFLSRERIAQMRPRRDPDQHRARRRSSTRTRWSRRCARASIAPCRPRRLHRRAAAAGHALTTLPNVTLSAHSAFRTPEASDNLIGAALDHCRRIIATGK